MTMPRGYTLIELVLVIAITGVLAVISIGILKAPLEQFVDLRAQSTYTQTAAVTLTRFSRELRASLPNSVRSNGTAVEWLQTTAASRYRALAPGGPEAVLDIHSADDSFDVFTAFGPAGPVSGERLAVYSLGVPGADPYSDAVLSPLLSNLTVTQVAAPGPAGYADEFRVTYQPAHVFPHSSPSQRIFRVSGPVSYLCTGTELRRFSAYTLSSVQPVLATDFLPATGELLARDLSHCEFRYALNNQLAGVLTVELRYGSGATGLRVLRQLRVENTP